MKTNSMEEVNTLPLDQGNTLPSTGEPYILEYYDYR